MDRSPSRMQQGPGLSTASVGAFDSKKLVQVDSLSKMLSTESSKNNFDKQCINLKRG